MFWYLAQSIQPNITAEIWGLLLANPIAGSLLGVLLILLPSVMGVFMLIFNRQDKFASKLIETVAHSTKELGDHLGDKLDTQTQLLTIALSERFKTNTLVKLLEDRKGESFNGHNPSFRKDEQNKQQ